MPISPKANTFRQTLVSFSQSTLDNTNVEISPFWASLFGSNAKPENFEEIFPVPNGHCLEIHIRSRVKLKDLWDIDSSNDKSMFTAMVSLSKNMVAVGFLGGEIAILQQTSLMMSKREDWLNNDAQLLSGHTRSVTALFFLESGQWNKKDLLFSGDSVGTIILWDVATASKIASFYNHSRRITQFLQVPAEVGGKFRSSIVALSFDNSVSLINPEELTW